MINIRNLIVRLYDSEKSDLILENINKLIEKYKISDERPVPRLSEQDVALICYADNIYSPGEKSLKKMTRFFNENFQGIISYIHLLPFYPFTSDDGFAVRDFYTVNEKYGDWRDIEIMGENFNLIFDAVVNHVSSQHNWFLEYLQNNPRYKNYFIEMDENSDLSSVVRARALPLLHRYHKNGEEITLWTTFSEDQVDLNYKNPEVLLEVLEILLFYISKGASVIRLDAIGYIWKELGTACINLPQTHEVVSLIRKVVDTVKKGVLLLPEVNVPSRENMQYFGDGNNEAQMVYQFCISPLVLYTFYSRNSYRIMEYLDNLPKLAENNYFFNVLATHDGIGLRPVHDILKNDEIELILREVDNREGRISYKQEQDGRLTPYELNITYFDALRDKELSESENIDKFIAAQAILLSIQGFPALYFHSLFGTRNYYEGFKITGQPRTLNRRKFEYDELCETLNDEFSHESQVFRKMRRLLEIRREEKAFHPKSSQKVMKLSPRVFSIVRGESEPVFVIINICNTVQNVMLPDKYRKCGFLNIIDNSHKRGLLEIKPFEILWLKIL